MMEEIRTVVDSYETAKANDIAIFYDVSLDGILYKPFIHSYDLYIPVVIHEPIYDIRTYLKKEVMYQRIPGYMIDKLVIKDGD